jgi:hypothetical protein
MTTAPSSQATARHGGEGHGDAHICREPLATESHSRSPRLGLREVSAILVERLCAAFRQLTRRRRHHPVELLVAPGLHRRRELLGLRTRLLLRNLESIAVVVLSPDNPPRRRAERPSSRDRLQPRYARSISGHDASPSTKRGIRICIMPLIRRADREIVHFGAVPPEGRRAVAGTPPPPTRSAVRR